MAISASTTQSFVPIKEVRDGVLVLKDGSVRAILLASSVNLSLKSAEEQEAIIRQFQNFLNSLDFTVQISIQSRRYDVRPYLALLEERMREQIEPLIKIQTREYIGFIRTFTEQVSIMTKSFFVVVPYTSNAISTTSGPLSFLGGNKNKSEVEKIEFEELRSQLEERVSVVEGGLGSLGIRTQMLGSDEVVELFYKIFNPGETTSSIKVESGIQ